MDCSFVKNIVGKPLENVNIVIYHFTLYAEAEVQLFFSWN